MKRIRVSDIVSGTENDFDRLIQDFARVKCPCGLRGCKAPFTRYNRLSNPFDNRLYGVNGVLHNSDAVKAMDGNNTPFIFTAAV